MWQSRIAASSNDYLYNNCSSRRVLRILSWKYNSLSFFVYQSFNVIVFVFLQILCLSCLLYKRWSDAEATRLFYFFEKSSREWPLLNNITRNGAGSLFADVTFGGYIIICVALYIAYLMGELKNSKKTVSPPPDWYPSQ